MFTHGDKSISRLRGFVSQRSRVKGGDTPGLVAEAAIQLLLPPLKDVLEEEPGETLAMRLTCAAAMVMIIDLLSQRLAATPWSRTAALALRHAAQRSGLDEAELHRSAGRVTATLAEFQPHAYRALCRDMDHALDRAIFSAQRSQGEVLVRLALERLEAMVQSGVTTDAPRTALDAVRRHGLLKVVQTNRVAPWLQQPALAPRRFWWFSLQPAG